MISWSFHRLLNAQMPVLFRVYSKYFLSNKDLLYLWQQDAKQYPFRRFVEFISELLIGLGMIFVGLGGWVILFILGIVFIPFFFIFTGTICAVFLGYDTCGTILQHQKRGSYDLLTLSRLGTSRLYFGLCQLIYRRNRNFNRVRDTARTIYFIIAPPVIGLSLLSNAAGLALAFLILGVSMWIDVIQATTIGHLIGILIPEYKHDLFTTRTITVGLILLVQIASLLSLVALWLLILPLIYNLIGWSQDFGMVIVGLILVFSVREGLITLIWRRTTQQFDLTFKYVLS